MYDAMGKGDAQKLQIIQNKCLRSCLKCHKRTHRIELHQRSGVLPLYIQRRIHTTGLVHKGLNGSSTKYINNMFNLGTTASGRVTRSEVKGEVHIPRVHLEMSKGNIAYRGGTTTTRCQTKLGELNRTGHLCTNYEDLLKVALNLTNSPDLSALIPSEYDVI